MSLKCNSIYFLTLLNDVYQLSIAKTAKWIKKKEKTNISA